jgi:hypothetical protein
VNAGRAPRPQSAAEEDVAARRSGAHALVLVASLASPLALLALGLLLRPDPRGWGTHEQLGFRPCYPQVHWNVPCPGCGVTTAVVLAVRGEFGAACATQPIGPLLVLGSLVFAAWALAGHHRGRDLAAELARWSWPVITRVAGLALLVGWLYKTAVVRGWF